MEAKDWANFLVDVRKNLIKIFAIIAISSISFFPFSPKLISFICDEMFPYQQLSQEDVEKIAEQLKRIAENITSTDNTTLIREELKKLSRISTSFLGPVVLTPMEAIVLSLKMSLAIGVALTIPYIIFLLSKALKAKGWLKVSTKYYVVASLLLFILGCFYGFFIVRLVIKFLHGITVAYGVTPLYSLSEFVTFVLFMILIFGFFFEIPVVMFFLVRNRLIQYRTLKYYRRHAYVLFFILAAIATPTVDIFTQTMLAFPMILLYELGMLFIGLSQRV
ncbi:MAG: twin-arginine translocase subunit TatC [Archaeoglobaceae archaeon]|nr:twin-arginine translocase subunit TatC [Archaeoglobaceae archaeon]MDW7989914.1 twin-arginine translocase subunit TatC [Archaeoglobaceae archaeon]